MKGKAFRCQVCGTEMFWQRRAQLRSSVAAFFDLEWASPTCECLIGSAWGDVHWFFPQE